MNSYEFFTKDVKDLWALLESIGTVKQFSGPNNEQLVELTPKGYATLFGLLGVFSVCLRLTSQDLVEPDQDMAALFEVYADVITEAFEVVSHVWKTREGVSA